MTEKQMQQALLDAWSALEIARRCLPTQGGTVPQRRAIAVARKHICWAQDRLEAHLEALEPQAAVTLSGVPADADAETINALDALASAMRRQFGGERGAMSELDAILNDILDERTCRALQKAMAWIDDLRGELVAATARAEAAEARLAAAIDRIEDREAALCVIPWEQIGRVCDGTATIADRRLVVDWCINRGA